MARSPGRPSGPPSRRRAAMSRAVCPSAGGASSRLKATSGARAATSVAPALGWGRRGPKSGRSSPARRRSASPARPPRRELGAGAPPGEGSVEEDREPELLGEQVGDEQRLGAGRSLVAPVNEDDGHDVDGTYVRVKPPRGAEVDGPHRGARPRRAPGRAPAGAVRLNTARWWSGSTCTSSSRPGGVPSAAAMRRMTSLSRPSETLGTASSGVGPGRPAAGDGGAARRSGDAVGSGGIGLGLGLGRHRHH